MAVRGLSARFMHMARGMSIDTQPSHPAVRVACIAAVAAVFLTLGHFGARIFLPTRVPGFSPSAGADEGTEFTGLSHTDPGEAGFPVPPSAEFVDAVGQANRTSSLMAVYRSSHMTPGQVAEYYTTEMARRGWKEDSRIANELNRHAPGIMLFFRHRHIECVVHVESERIGTGSRWGVIFGRKIFGGGKR